MKILFMDIDGPMIPHRAYLMPGNYGRLVTHFDHCATAMVNRLLRLAPAKLVISSAWQINGRVKMEELLTMNGIDSGHLHEDWATSPPGPMKRRAEIKLWLRRHPEVTHWVAFDDEPVPAPGCIQCSFADGLLMKHFEMSFQLLGIEKWVAWTEKVDA